MILQYGDEIRSFFCESVVFYIKMAYTKINEI